MISSLNTNFEDSLFEIGPIDEAPLLRKGEKEKGERVESELRRLLEEKRGGRKVENNLDGYEMVGGGWENQMVGGGWEHPDGGGELRRLLVGAAAGPMHGRKVENNIGALHGSTTSRHQGWKIST